MVITANREPVSPEHVLMSIAEAGVRLVDLQFSDIGGGAKSMTIPVELLASTMESGYRFDGSALTGGLRKIELDLYLVPDPGTLMLIPSMAAGEPRARLSCSVRRRDGAPFAGDPRSALERAIASAEAAGFIPNLVIEMEYYLLPSDHAGPVLPQASAGYFDVGDQLVAATRDEVLATLQGMGISVGGAHHETGPGQEEIDLLTTDALTMADQLTAVRQVIRSVALRHGLRATFMPKPMTDAPGSGMHLFLSLRRTDGSDALREGDGLSRTAEWAMGGLLTHAGGLCLTTNPSVNSYKRLNAGHRAPRHATWARVSQSSLIRVPTWAEEGEGEIELRSPDAMANPYLALASILHCVINGIREQLDPGQPLDESFVSYDDVELSRLGVARLPSTLGEAIATFAEDPVVQAAVGDYISDQLLTVKRVEWEAYRAHVSPWEFNRYADS